MKILLFIESIVAGGAERQMVVLAKLLKEHGCEVRIVTYFDIPFYAPYLIDNCIEYECISKATNKYSRIFRLFDYFKKFGPDVVISYLDTPNLFSIVLRFLGLKYKLIVSERNTTQSLSFRTRLKFFLYRFSDHIVPNSLTQTQFIKLHFPELVSKVKMITNFIDTDFFCPSPQLFHEKEELMIVVAGRFDWHKNVNRLIQAIDQLVKRGLKISVNWYGDNYFRNGKPTTASKVYFDAVALTENLNLSKFISFHEPVHNIKDLYRNADVFCLPSIYEGFPNVICEAMACGKPILASNICDNPLLVEDGINGFLFNPLTSDSIANAIDKFYNLNFYEKQIMGLKSRKIAIEKFSKTAFVMSYLTLIN